MASRLNTVYGAALTLIAGTFANLTNEMTSSALCFLCYLVQTWMAVVRLCARLSVCLSVRVCACVPILARARSARTLLPPRARRHALGLRRWHRQAPDGRRAAQGDDGNLAQSLPEDPGLAGHAAQV